MEKDTLKLWQLTRTLNNDTPERRQNVLEINGELQTGEKAANTCEHVYGPTKKKVLANYQETEQKQFVNKPENPPSRCMTDAI